MQRKYAIKYGVRWRSIKRLALAAQGKRAPHGHLRPSARGLPEHHADQPPRREKAQPRFATVINCIDGRVQEPVAGWLKERYQLDYVDVITEPGPERLLSRGDAEAEASLRDKVELSFRAHGSSVIALAGHHDCAGNPVSAADHCEQIRKGVQTIRRWGLPASIVGLWVNEEWRVQEVSD